MQAITQDDMEARFGVDHVLEIADKDGGGDLASTENAAFLAAHLAQSRSFAAHICGELDETPAHVTAWMCDIAAYTMAKESRGSLGEEHRTAYMAAVDGLRQLRTPDTVEMVSSYSDFSLSDTDGLL